MKLQHHIQRELTDKVADEYIRLSKTKTEILIIEKLCDVLESIKQPEDERFIDHFKWTTFCIWESIYINYHKLFSGSMGAEEGQKVNKFKITAKEFLKSAPKELIDLHDKILSIRNHFFVHGGTEIYENYKLFADIKVYEGRTRIQLNIEGIKEPTIENSDIPTVRKLLNYLLNILTQKLTRCNKKITDALHAEIENNFSIS